jgi:hypothetical protein
LLCSPRGTFSHTIIARRPGSHARQDDVQQGCRDRQAPREWSREHNNALFIVFVEAQPFLVLANRAKQQLNMIQRPSGSFSKRHEHSTVAERDWLWYVHNRNVQL